MRTLVLALFAALAVQASSVAPTGTLNVDFGDGSGLQSLAALSFVQNANTWDGTADYTDSDFQFHVSANVIWNSVSGAVTYSLEADNVVNQPPVDPATGFVLDFSISGEPQPTNTMTSSITANGTAGVDGFTGTPYFGSFVVGSGGNPESAGGLDNGFAGCAIPDSDSNTCAYTQVSDTLGGSVNNPLEIQAGFNVPVDANADPNAFAVNGAIAFAPDTSVPEPSSLLLLSPALLLLRRLKRAA